MNHKAMDLWTVHAAALLGLALLAGCGQGGTDRTADAPEEAGETSAFSYDPAEFPGAKPWTSESFKNDPDHFQFAVLGDRGGGASPLGTYERAMAPHC